MAKENLTAARLRELLHYDTDTGVFTWKVRAAPHRPAGSLAGSRHWEGYLRIKIEEREYLAHRLAFLYMKGAWPRNQVDHMDGNRANNRWSNLRDVTPTANMQNIRVARPHSSVGLLGVTRQKGRFVARIRVGSDRKYLGGFDTAEEAHAAYVEAKRRFHPYNTL